ncbi:hypothetical protein OG218_09150 [Kineococcus sp. NBC_00420]|uniref:hypothetical protein n=1 Tax=Kineococcus sp. NBC_00420 TaxID=2903564 RepID=UPI002E1FFB87
MSKTPKAPLTVEQAAKRKRTNKRILIGAGIFIAFCVGAAAGGGGSDDASADVAGSAPTATVTVTASSAAEPVAAATVTAPAATVTVTADAPAPAPAAVQQASGKSVGNGDWLVGSDVEPGTYKSSGVDGSLCYADTSDGNGNINQQEVTPEGPTIITVSAKDKVFSVSGCEDFVLQ